MIHFWLVTGQPLETAVGRGTMDRWNGSVSFPSVYLSIYQSISEFYRPAYRERMGQPYVQVVASRLEIFPGYVPIAKLNQKVRISAGCIRTGQMMCI